MLRKLSLFPTATQIAASIAAGETTPSNVLHEHFTLIDEREHEVHAWTVVDREAALEDAQQLERATSPRGLLHGVPFGIKDNIDTADLLTEYGSSIHTGHQPGRDATCVAGLRLAGGIAMGKTVCTEFAHRAPRATRNPWNVAHTPGGSSSGSAAAVAAYHVPLAIGTQTNGSVIRPASFCGTYGFKPTRGVISRRGVLQTSKSLDQVGVFGRTLEDVALLTDVIGSYDPRDIWSYARSRPKMLEGCRAEAPVEPAFVWLDLPYHDRLTTDARAGFDEVISVLGATVERIPVSKNLIGLVEVQQVIHEYEICHHLETEFAEHWDMVSTSLQPVVERGRTIGDDQYNEALQVMASAVEYFEAFFKDYDAVIAPSAAGEALKFGTGTGDPVFCTIWTLCGLPSLNLPLLVGEHGLPIGVQLIGAAEEDDRLLRTANWLLNHLQSDLD